MLKNKIEIYDNNGNFIKEYDELSGHDLVRTLFNKVSELEGWGTIVDYIGFNGTIKGSESSRDIESRRWEKQKNIEETKIINAFAINGIGRIVFTGRNGYSFGLAYEKGRLIFDKEFLD